jgi:hypothetical protein
MLGDPLPRGHTVDRCAALPQPELLARVPLDRILAERPGAQVSYSNGVLSLHAATGQWDYAARAAIELDPAWYERDIIVRVRLTVRAGDIAVVVLDDASSKEVSPERPFETADEEATAYLSVRSGHRRVSLMFKRTLPDNVSSEVVVREISILAK